MNDNGKWVTIKGRHIFIKDGESVQDALNRSIAEENENKKQEQIASNAKESKKLNDAERYTQTLKAKEDRIRNQSFESAILLSTSGDVLFDKDGEKDKVVFSEDDCAKMVGATLTHNHPGSSVFSFQDLQVLDKNGLKEIRAVCKNGKLFSLTRIGNNDTSECNFTYAYYQECQRIRKEEADVFWANSKQDEVAAMTANTMLDDAKRKWLKENAASYGYKYSER